MSPRVADRRRRVLPLNVSFLWDVLCAAGVEEISTLPTPQTQTPKQGVSIKDKIAEIMPQMVLGYCLGTIIVLTII